MATQTFDYNRPFGSLAGLQFTRNTKSPFLMVAMNDGTLCHCTYLSKYSLPRYHDNISLILVMRANKIRLNRMRIVEL